MKIKGIQSSKNEWTFVSVDKKCIDESYVDICSAFTDKVQCNCHFPAAGCHSCFYCVILGSWSRGRLVSIVSDYGLDDRAIGVRSSAGANDFSSNLCVQTGPDADHPSSAEVKNE
jgi:hypothetical protein